MYINFKTLNDDDKFKYIMKHKLWKDVTAKMFQNL